MSKHSSKCTIRAIIGSKGQINGGQPYDFTKVYIPSPVDPLRGKGLVDMEFRFGTSENFERLKHLEFPLEALVTFETVTNGRINKTVITDIQPEKKSS